RDESPDPGSELHAFGVELQRAELGSAGAAGILELLAWHVALQVAERISKRPSARRRPAIGGIVLRLLRWRVERVRRLRIWRFDVRLLCLLPLRRFRCGPLSTGLLRWRRWRGFDALRRVAARKR